MEWIYRTMAGFVIMIIGFGIHAYLAERKERK